MKKILLAAALCIGLAGCGFYNEERAPETSSLNRFSPLQVQVASVDSRNEYNAITTTGDVAYKFGTTPAKLVQNYIDRRFKAAGGAGNLRFHVKRASAVEEDVPAENSMLEAVQLANQKRLRVTLQVMAEVSGTANNGTVTFNTERAKVFPSYASIGEREEAARQMVDDMLNELDGQVMRGLNRFQVLAPSVLDTTGIPDPL